MIEDTMFDNDCYAVFMEEEHEKEKRVRDNISRQAAIEWCLEGLNNMPSAEPKSGKWIPCSERLPKENECVGNVWKYYLIQDEYEDMHVAHLSSRGWETIESFKALECDVVAWMPLPEPYKGARTSENNNRF